MKAATEFVKTATIGGLLVLVPAYLSILLVMHAVAGLLALVTPIASLMPGGPHVEQLLSLVLILLVSFVIGLLVRTRFGRYANNIVEQRVLERIPGYTLMRSLSRRFSGGEEGVDFAVALVEIEEALVPAFLVEEHADGSFTVFVPSVPTPAAGTVYVLPKERVHRVDVPLTTALRTITQWGMGTSELLQAMRKVERPA